MHNKLDPRSKAALLRLKPEDEVNAFIRIKGTFDKARRNELAGLGIHLHFETGPIATCHFLVKDLDGLLALDYIASVQFGRPMYLD